MSSKFVFATINEYNIGVQQLISILRNSKIETSVEFSQYNCLDICYLRHKAFLGTTIEREKATKLLERDIDNIAKRVLDQAPSVVGFSVTTDLYQFWLSVAGKLKKTCPRVKIIFGGHHPTFEPESVISQASVDALCIGEGDQNIVPLVQYFSNEGHTAIIPGTWIKTTSAIVRSSVGPLVGDLDSLPMPDASDYYSNGTSDTSYAVITSRGCPYSCSYCGSSAIKSMYKGLGKYLRKRSPSSVISELREAISRFPIKYIAFVDDVFTMDAKWLKVFLSEYKKFISLPYYCLVHPDSIEEDTIQLLHDTGCTNIKMGVQHVNKDICVNSFHRSIDLDKIRRIISAAKRIGIRIKTDYIIGAPGETEKDLNDMASFIKEVKADDIFVFFLRYYPGTKLLKQAIDEGTFSEDEVYNLREGHELGCQAIPLRFQGEQRLFYEKYNKVLRDAAGSSFSIDQFSSLLDSDC